MPFRARNPSVDCGPHGHIRGRQAASRRGSLLRDSGDLNFGSYRLAYSDEHAHSKPNA